MKDTIQSCRRCLLCLWFNSHWYHFGFLCTENIQLSLLQLKDHTAQLLVVQEHCPKEHDVTLFPIFGSKYAPTPGA